VVRQDAGVQHVGVADHHVRAGTDGAARVLRRVAVVGVHADLGAAGPLICVTSSCSSAIWSCASALVGKQVERAGRRILQHAVEHRQVVAERLARGRGRGDDDVAPGSDVGKRLGLVRIELGGAARRQRGRQPRIEPVRKRRERRRRGRQAPHRRDHAVRGVGPID
jgi:hypothetical protein